MNRAVTVGVGPTVFRVCIHNQYFIEFDMNIHNETAEQIVSEMYAHQDVFDSDLDTLRRTNGAIQTMATMKSEITMCLVHKIKEFKEFLPRQVGRFTVRPMFSLPSPRNEKKT